MTSYNQIQPVMKIYQTQNNLYRDNETNVHNMDKNETHDTTFSDILRQKCTSVVIKY